MIDQGPILDPGQNFTRSQNLATGARLPEYTLRQLIGSELRRYRESAGLASSPLNELFSRYPVALAQFKKFLIEHPNLQVQVNWPRNDINLPWIAVVSLEEQESSEDDFLGDHGGLLRTGELTGAKQTVRALRVVSEHRHINVIIGTQDSDLTLFLHQLVKRTIHENKMNLIEWEAMHNLTVSGRDMALDTGELPSFGYYKAVSLQFQTTFDYNEGEQSALIAGVGLRVNALKDGVVVPSPVPSETL